MSWRVSARNPIEELEDFNRRWTPWFSRTSRELPSEESQPMTMIDWAPTVDVAENDSAYLVTAELPQVRKEDTKVSIEDGCLTISGERKK